jgi:uncharacterized protein (DUF1015 family)
VCVPRFQPFAALRYAPDRDLDDVSAPPYDVLSDADVAALRARSAENIVVVDVPSEADGPDRYERAAATLRSWVHDGVMVADERPSFTLYRMSFVDEAGDHRETVGVLGALEVVDEGAGGVLPHEQTTPKAKSDRLDLTEATSANLSPVWGLSLAAGLTDVLLAPGEPVGRCTDAEGVVHTVERVTDPDRVGAISAAVGRAPVLIADGHHRYAISRTYRDRRRAATGRTDTDAELTLTYVAELVESQLSVAAIHRLLHGVDAVALLDALAEWFEPSPAGAVGPAHARSVIEEGALCFVAPDGTGTFLHPRAERFESVRDLDSARLEHALTAIGATDVTYQHGVSHVLEALREGRAAAGVLLRPVSITEIRRTADEGLLMPPKSTFFTPKLRTGLVVRPLAG